VRFKHAFIEIIVWICPPLILTTRYAGAPRLLQAIARDDIIPFLSIFKATNAKNEPIRAIILTFFIAEIGILIANIETVAPLIDVYVFSIVYCATDSDSK